MKRLPVHGAENDVVSRYWRARYCYTQRAGVTDRVKRRIRRRERRAGWRELIQEVVEVLDRR